VGVKNGFKYKKGKPVELVYPFYIEIINQSEKQ
jgi:hypothetical protein